jgi:hypothetical protein
MEKPTVWIFEGKDKAKIEKQVQDTLAVISALKLKPEVKYQAEYIPTSNLSGDWHYSILIYEV